MDDLPKSSIIELPAGNKHIEITYCIFPSGTTQFQRVVFMIGAEVSDSSHEKIIDLIIEKNPNIPREYMEFYELKSVRGHFSMERILLNAMLARAHYRRSQRSSVWVDDMVKEVFAPHL